MPRSSRLSMLLLSGVAACSARDVAPRTALESLRDASPAVVQEAAARLIARGEAAIPELLAALDDPDPRFAANARKALSSITGQWGADTGMVWKRSVAEAVNDDRPLLVLHLFGKLDEEFC